MRGHGELVTGSRTQENTSETPFPIGSPADRRSEAGYPRRRLEIEQRRGTVMLAAWGPVVKKVNVRIE
jgi:hypothetical protein